jgi:anti-sigma B factor antagonist
MESPIQTSLAEDGTALIAVLGEIDFTNADEVACAIRDAVSRWSPATVRVDLRQATFIDSTGLGALIAGYRAAIDGQSRFVVTNPTSGFRRMLVVTGLCELFGVPDQEDAGTHRSSDIAI